MNSDSRFVSPLFPRASRYHPDWIAAGVSGGANSLWLTEWLAASMNLRAGMRVLDLGCGRAASSIFLHRELGAQVWAANLWFSPEENLQRVRDAGAADGVFPIHADARALPFGAEFFDAIVSIDSFMYFGTDDLFLNSLARLVKPSGQVGIALSVLTQEVTGAVPEHLREMWTPDLWRLHSAPWWRRHWERTGILSIEAADTIPDGWQRWLEWEHVIAPDNHVEHRALEADRREYLGYVRVVGRRRSDVSLEAPIISVPARYEKRPLLRG